MMCKVFSYNDFNNTKLFEGGGIAFKGGKFPPLTPFVENTLIATFIVAIVLFM